MASVLRMVPAFSLHHTWGPESHTSMPDCQLSEPWKGSLSFGLAADHQVAFGVLPQVSATRDPSLHLILALRQAGVLLFEGPLSVLLCHGWARSCAPQQNAPILLHGAQV